MLQTYAPDAFEDARSHPGLKPQMARAAGTVLAGNHLPLAACAQDIENAVEHGAIQHAGTAIGTGRFVGRQHGFDPFPQVIRNLAESIPLLGCSTHRVVLHDVTMLMYRPSRTRNMRVLGRTLIVKPL